MTACVPLCAEHTALPMSLPARIRIEFAEVWMPNHPRNSQLGRARVFGHAHRLNRASVDRLERRRKNCTSGPSLLYLAHDTALQRIGDQVAPYAPP